jgi:transcriptional regulator with XRE-family HTH domain
LAAHTHNNGIGVRLRAARDRLGLSREALAFHSGISWSAIAQAESGRRTNLRPATLLALADALGVTIDYLVCGRRSSVTMFDHGTFSYGSEREFVETAAPFLAAAVKRSEVALAVTSAVNIRLLRDALGASAAQVTFADHLEWYRSPSAALVGYNEFLEQALDRGASWVCVIGEPPWGSRSEADRRLRSRYESLVNLVFASAPVSVYCPYDTRALDSQVLEQARTTHPQLVDRGAVVASRDYVDPAESVLEG